MALKENKQLFDSLDKNKKQQAVDFLKDNLVDQDFLREEINKDPENWISPLHFNWGMFIRNLLRQNGFGEEFFPVDDLDDIYVELIEEAVIIRKCVCSIQTLMSVGCICKEK